MSLLKRSTLFIKACTFPYSSTELYCVKEKVKTGVCFLSSLSHVKVCPRRQRQLLPGGIFPPANQIGLHLSASIMSSETSVQDLKAEHEPTNKRFVVSIGKVKAVLDYDEMGSGILDLYHTEVPVKLRGQGIAQILAKAAFDHVVENNLKMKLSCTYLQDYFIKHPDEKYKKHLYSTIE